MLLQKHWFLSSFYINNQVINSLIFDSNIIYRYNITLLKYDILEQFLRMKNFKKLTKFRFGSVMAFCNRGIMIYPPKYYLFAIFTLFCCIFPMLFASPIKADYNNYKLENLEILLRVICAIMPITLIIKHCWENKVDKNHIPIIWYGMLLLCFPTLGTCSFIINSGQVEVIIGLVISVLALAALVDWLSFIVLAILGFALGHVLYMIAVLLTGSSFTYHSHSNLSLLYPALSLIISVMMKYAQENEIKLIKTFGGAIAHEMRSPMAAAYSGITAIANSIDHHSMLSINQATVNGKTIDTDTNKILVMKNKDYEFITYILNNLQSILDNGMKSAESILMAMSRANNDLDKAEHSVLKAVREAVKIHHMSEEERSRVRILERDQDFSFYGTYKLFRHVIHNLLANALKYAGSKAQITIWIEGQSLYFRDNGNGIAANDIKQIFDIFYTTRGNGLGLAFCKTIITDIGGSITCKSELRQYTEFVITLPKLKQNAI